MNPLITTHPELVLPLMRREAAQRLATRRLPIPARSRLRRRAVG